MIVFALFPARTANSDTSIYLASATAVHSEDVSLSVSARANVPSARAPNIFRAFCLVSRVDWDRFTAIFRSTEACEGRFESKAIAWERES